MRAKYAGVCRRCHGNIAVGDDIQWKKGERAEHTVCPTPAATPIGKKQRPSPRPPPPPSVPGEFTVERPSLGRHDGYQVGECVFFEKVGAGTYGVVIEAGKTKDEIGNGEWLCWARVRPATQAESAPLRAQREAALTRTTAMKRLREIHDQLRRNHRTGQAPPIGGRRIVIHRAPMGPETIFIVLAESIYAAHPGEYDDWQPSYGYTQDAMLAAEVLSLADTLRL